MKKNEEREISVFYVEPNVKYFWFFDLYGSTMKICAYSGVPIKGKYRRKLYGEQIWRARPGFIKNVKLQDGQIDMRREIICK